MHRLALLGLQTFATPSLSLADTSDYGLLRMIVSDAEKCKASLKEAGFSAHLTPVIAVKLSHQVGKLQEVLAEIDGMTGLYNKSTGEKYNSELKICDTNIKNGIELILA